MEREYKDGSSRTLEKVVANSPLGIGFFNENGHWLHVNPSLISLLGYSEEEMNQLTFFKLFDDQESLNESQTFLKQLQSDVTGSRSHEVILIKQDRSKIWASITYTLMNHTNTVNTVYSVQIHDLTDQKRSKAYFLENDPNHLAAGIVHEVKNPLTAIKGFIQLMLQNGNTENYLKIIESEVNRMESMLNEFLLLGKPHELNPEPVDFLHLVNQVVTLLQTQAISKQAEIELHSEGKLPIVMCEEARIKQVFINLIKNAIEATPNDSLITIKIETEQDQIKAKIRDQGPGIPKEELPLLGRPFFSTKKSGTGLGLMMSFSIMKEHHGKIEFESDSTGTTAIVTLPILPQLS